MMALGLQWVTFETPPGASGSELVLFLAKTSSHIEQNNGIVLLAVYLAQGQAKIETSQEGYASP